MLHKQITPQTTDICIAIPQDYVGRKLELLVYAVDEPVDLPLIQESQPSMSAFKGILTREQGEELLAYVQKSRHDWE